MYRVDHNKEQPKLEDLPDVPPAIPPAEHEDIIPTCDTEPGHVSIEMAPLVNKSQKEDTSQHESDDAPLLGEADSEPDTTSIIAPPPRWLVFLACLVCSQSGRL